MNNSVSWGALPERLRETGGDIAAATEALLDALTDEELVGLLTAPRLIKEVAAAVRRRHPFLLYVAAAVDRLNAPGIRFTDGPRGIVVGHSTAFPSAMARGATFDPDLERRIGHAIGLEATAHGANLYAGVCVNLLRHPAWGRSQETYGEDPLLLGTMGAALIQAAGAHVATCAKHYACNSIDTSRFWVDVNVAEADLRDIYLPHFRRCVDAGADAVMSAYNKVNGQWCGHNGHLLTEILKGEWGFQGFVMSDFGLGVRDRVAAAHGGLDIDMLPIGGRARRLRRAVAEGRVTREQVRESASRITRALFAACRRSEGAVAPRNVIESEDHLAVARQTACRSFVLLQNNVCDGAPALPIEGRVREVALVGRLASLNNTGDRGSSNVRCSRVVTIAEGFAALAPAHGIQLRDSLTDAPNDARKAASGADAAVVVVGCTWRDEGEFIGVYGGDRPTLALSQRHQRLIETVAAVCPRTVVVLVGGSAFLCEPWRSRVAAILMTWYSGAQGGLAIAEAVFGMQVPGGRLPCTWPANEEQLPPFSRWTTRIVYGPLHGYRLFHATKQQPAFWFGHGLGYAPIEWGAPTLHEDDDGTQITVPLRNTGNIDQREVVQVYADVALGTYPEPLPTLAGFTSVELAPGEDRLVRVRLDDTLRSRARPGAILWVGRSAGSLTPAGRGF